MKKNFCPKRNKPKYRPAVFKNGQSRTYLNIYFTTKKEAYEHVKRSFDLGMILNIDLRKKRGEEIAELINWWLDNNYFFEDFEKMKAIKMKQEYDEKQKENTKSKEQLLLETTLVDAMDEALNIKLKQTKNKRTKIDHKSIHTFFIEYLKENNITENFASNFNRGDAMKYLLDQKENRGWSNNNFNSYRGKIGKFWTQIINLGYAHKNPFSGSFYKMISQFKNSKVKLSINFTTIKGFFIKMLN